jgi:uncharacterized protein
MPGSAALVRRGCEAINTPDPETLAGLLDEGVAWHTPGLSPLAGDAIGRDAVLAHFGRCMGETLGTFRADLQRVLTDEDGRVLGIHHNTAVRNGKSLDVYCCVVFELRNGRIVDGREHFHDLESWDEFWS